MIKDINELNIPDSYEKEAYEYIEDVLSYAILLRHKKSGARVLVLSNEDNNKVFNIGFRTPSNSSKGVQHIIEHTVLCGSKNFPVKDPFIELVKGSVNTYLNASTYPDKTMYPVASYNDRDFKNLMHVYMDAVFNPNIYEYEEIFKQEGWHYELFDKNEPIILNGVVYNEMKGAYSSEENLLENNLLKALYPDNEYRYDSGGDPVDIPLLTREEYLNYHRNYYHPSNSYIYLYGDMDVIERLEWMDENYLKNYDIKKIDSDISLQSDFDKVYESKFNYAVSEEDTEDKKTMYAYGVRLDVTQDIKTTIALSLLSDILIDSSGAVIKEAIVKAGLGENVSSDYCDLLKQGYLAIYIKNAPKDKKQEIFNLIEEKIRETIEKGIEKNILISKLNSKIFALREKEFGRTPKGLIYGLKAFKTWLYDDSAAFKWFKEKEIYDELTLEVESGYFEKLLEKYLINNNNKVIIEAVPDTGLAAKVEEAEKTKLAEYKASLSDEEIDKLIEDTIKLKEYQNTPSTKEELQKIPMLTRNDLAKKVDWVNVYEDEIDGIKVLRAPVETDGISYFGIYLNMNDYKDIMSSISAYTEFMGLLDSENYDYKSLEVFRDMYLGGCSYSLDSVVDKEENITLNVVAMVKCLENNLDKAFVYLIETMFKTKFDDVERMKELFAESLSNMKTANMYMGHITAATRALSHVFEDEKIKDSISGIGGQEFLKKLIQSEDINNFKDYLEKIQDVFRLRKNLSFFHMGNDESFEKFKTEIRKSEFLSYFKDEDVSIERKYTNQNETTYKSEGFVTPGMVQYVACGGKFDFSHTKQGVMAVVDSLLNSGYLWNNVRVLNGAYGVSAKLSRFGAKNGKGLLTSYRDPKLTETLEAYKGVVSFLKNFDLDERELDKAVISTAGTQDSPVSEFIRGLRSIINYRLGVTEEEANKHRDELLNVRNEDIREYAEVFKEIIDAGEICVIGSEEKIRANEDIFNNIVTF